MSAAESELEEQMHGRLIVVILALSVLVGLGSAAAQDCSIAAYADPEGTRSLMNHDVLDRLGYFSIFIVLFAEDSVAAAAYKFSLDGLGVDVFLALRIVGPTGNGIWLNEDPASIGTNVALTECVFGFGGTAVLVEEYSMMPLPWYTGGSAYLSPNSNQDPDSPVYVTCNHVNKACTVGPLLRLVTVLPTNQASFGSIKSLYR
jgi:hypothetical protein